MVVKVALEQLVKVQLLRRDDLSNWHQMLCQPTLWIRRFFTQPSFRHEVCDFASRRCKFADDALREVLERWRTTQMTKCHLLPPKYW
jgi:hypothetical protein